MIIESPRLTVNTLGEYLVARPKRQRKILQQLKYPKENTFSASAYKEAREAIKSYFISGFEEEIIQNCNTALQSNLDSARSDYHENMLNSQIEALEAVLDSDNIDDSFEYIKYEGENEKMEIEGVEISVYPDLIVRSKIRRQKYMGSMKIHLSKSGQINSDGGEYIAALLNKYTQEHIQIPNSFKLRSENSISYDVFSDSFVHCPNSCKRKLDDIVAGCQNIAAIWSTI